VADDAGIVHSHREQQRSRRRRVIRSGQASADIRRARPGKPQSGRVNVGRARRVRRRTLQAGRPRGRHAPAATRRRTPHRRRDPLRPAALHIAQRCSTRKVSRRAPTVVTVGLRVRDAAREGSRRSRGPGGGWRGRRSPVPGHSIDIEPTPDPDRASQREEHHAHDHGKPDATRTAVAGPGAAVRQIRGGVHRQRLDAQRSPGMPAFDRPLWTITPHIATVGTVAIAGSDRWPMTCGGCTV
jgi:hypothetical protein